MLFLYFVLLACSTVLLVAGLVEQARHFANLNRIPTRVLVNGIRGKSSITRLCAGALRGGDLVTVAKTTGTAARFIHPDATEEPVYRKFGIANVVEQIGIVRRAAAYRPDALVIECMAVMPALQEINQSKLIRSTIGVLCNVREDHLAEMGPTLDDVARSLSRSMPHDGICVTAEKDRFAILQEEADARNCQLVYADPDTVSDEELRGFSWFTFKENVAIALKVAELLGVERATALQGMYDAPPDPGVLSVERYLTHDGRRLRFANVFAANDPESTLMNINQLLDLGAVHRPLHVVVNCRPDRVERNGQMGAIIPELQPEKVFVIGHPAKSAIDAIPAPWRDRAVDLGGDRRDPEEFMRELLGMLGPDSSLVAIGNIHGQGELLLEHLAELPPDETPDPEDGEGPGAGSGGPSQPGRAPEASLPDASTTAASITAASITAASTSQDQAADTMAIPVVSAAPAPAPAPASAPGTAPAPAPDPHPRHDETLALARYAPRLDPYQPYPAAYEQRYQQRPAAEPPRERGLFEPVRMPANGDSGDAAEQPPRPEPQHPSRSETQPQPQTPHPSHPSHSSHPTNPSHSVAPQNPGEPR
ncbi:poly-gamma-glutamate synthase PgsB [Streptomyces sp. NPDC002018]|uniref:poly-gamma-glutamate synthase PgsB n=1 Tax=Streptomyces sp. NPDC002018 TaxID=3364629 RepID=UPI003673E60C